MSRSHFYIRFASCDYARLQQLVEQLRPLGAVRDSDVGTVKDPQSSWVELYAKFDTIERVREQLTVHGVDNDHVPEVVQIDRGEGRAQARQLDLFGGP